MGFVINAKQATSMLMVSVWKTPGVSVLLLLQMAGKSVWHVRRNCILYLIQNKWNVSVMLGMRSIIGLDFWWNVCLYVVTGLFFFHMSSVMIRIQKMMMDVIQRVKFKMSFNAQLNNQLSVFYIMTLIFFSLVMFCVWFHRIELYWFSKSSHQPKHLPNLNGSKWWPSSSFRLMQSNHLK